MKEWFVHTFFCTTCRANVQLVQDGAHYYRVPMEPTVDYFFGHCPKCQSVGLIDSVQVNEYESADTQLFPVMLTAVNVSLPSLVRESYDEAMKCEAAGVAIASVVMVRRTLEAIGKEFAPTAKTLFQGLQVMAADGAISTEMKEWGDQLRFIGNIGAHPTAEDAVTALDAKEAIEFLNAIVETIYVLRPKFQAMRGRRAKANTLPSS